MNAFANYYICSLLINFLEKVFFLVLTHSIKGLLKLIPSKNTYFIEYTKL